MQNEGFVGSCWWRTRGVAYRGAPAQPLSPTQSSSCPNFGGIVHIPAGNFNFSIARGRYICTTACTQLPNSKTKREAAEPSPGRRGPLCHLSMMRSAAFLLARTNTAALCGHAAVARVQNAKPSFCSHTHSHPWLQRVTARRSQRFSSPSSQENAPRNSRLAAAEADLASLENTWQLLRPAGPGVCVYLQEVERFMNDTNLDFDWLVSAAASRLHVVGECGACICLLHLWLPWTCSHQRNCLRKS